MTHRATSKPAPKRAALAFAFFAQTRRPALLEHRAELAGRLVEQERVLVAEWRTLTDAEQAPYEEEAARDRKRYEMEMAAFRAGETERLQGTPASYEEPPKTFEELPETQIAEPEPPKTFEELPKTQIAAPAEPVGQGIPVVGTTSAEGRAPKRPPSAFAFFARSRRPSLLTAQPELEQKPREQEKKLVAEWRALTDDDVAVYEKEAECDRERYKAQQTTFHE